MENGRRMATPLFVALLVIETTDVAFAVDSIPAVFSVSRDPFIVLTSNIFAILGLRALYFALAAVAKYFKYLKYGLGIILIFVGIKMLLAMNEYINSLGTLVGLDLNIPQIEVPTPVSLAVIFGVLVLPMLLRFAVKYAKDVTIWKEHKDEINRRIKKFKKSQDYKLIDNKEQEIEDIIQTVVQGISVDPRRLFTLEQKEELVRQYLADPERHKDNKIRCEDCKHFFFEDELTVDHIEPWSKGGRTELSNAQLLCRPCNSKQGNRK